MNTMPETSDSRRLEASTLLVATVTSFVGPYLISAVNVALPVIQTKFAVSAVMLSRVATHVLPVVHRRIYGTDGEN
ncbi:MAG: hypothetical protein C4518_14220 [Desulfobacteraceae bacterium]|nr:MAG: hypothetical protein C4518_14220 [Desulfobacteraceae bacterium]